MPDRVDTPAFAKAVLGLNGGPTDPLIVHIASGLAKTARAELVAVHVVEVDWTHELADDIASDDEQAARILDLAEAAAERAGVRLTTELLQARDVGAALVDEASELGADAIFLGLPYRKRFGGDFALGTTVPYVFQNAPCQVLVVREPVETAEQRSATDGRPTMEALTTTPRADAGTGVVRAAVRTAEDSRSRRNGFGRLRVPGRGR